jgi:hypothetical protein
MGTYGDHLCAIKVTSHSCPDPLQRTVIAEARGGAGHHVLGRIRLLVAEGRSGVLMSYVAEGRLFDDVVVQECDVTLIAHK